MAIPEATHCIGCAKDISKSSRDRRKLVPDSASSVWKVLFRKHCSNLLAFDTGDQKGAEEYSKGSSIPRWKDDKNIPPSKERHDNFQLQAFQCVAVYLQSELKPEYLPHTYGGTETDILIYYFFTHQLFLEVVFMR